jgi:hypothetical protein
MASAAGTVRLLRILNLCLNLQHLAALYSIQRESQPNAIAALMLFSTRYCYEDSFRSACCRLNSASSMRGIVSAEFVQPGRGSIGSDQFSGASMPSAHGTAIQEPDAEARF